MMENNSTIQTQNFVLEPKLNIWQRFGLWLKNLTPRKKGLFWVAMIVGLIAVVLIIYFVTAAVNSSFSFMPQSGDWEQGSTHIVKVTVEANDEQPIIGLNMKIKFSSDSGSMSNWNIQANVNNDKANLLQTPVINMQQQTISLISNIANKESIVSVGNIIDLLDIQFKVPESAPANSQVILEFYPINENFVLIPIGLSGGRNFDNLALEFDKDKTFQIGSSAKFNITPKQRGNDSIYFSPSSGDINLGDELNVDVMLNVASADIVVADIKMDYEINELELLGVIESDEFEQYDIELEDHDGKRTGDIRLIRGITGDQNINNGYKGEQIKLATLRFRATNSADSSLLTTHDSQIVLDDGQGTINTNYQEASANYKILTINDLVILSGPEATIYDDENSESWQADISWRTNLASDSKVYYSVKQGGSCRAIKKIQNLNVQNTNQTTDHLINLTNLLKNQTYCYFVRSQNNEGKSVESDEHEFITGDISSRLQIRNLKVQPEYNSATFNWNTIGGSRNGLANSEVSCTGPNDFSSTVTKPVRTLLHQVKITGLQKNTTYECVVSSRNFGGGSEIDEVSISFTTENVQTFETNKFLKVVRDRECDEWLYCRSAVEIINGNEQKENLCFDIGICDELGADGSCAAVVTNRNFSTQQTFEDVEEIKNLSGLAKVGFEWSENQKIDGYSDYGTMLPQGADINLANGDFESGEIWPWATNENAKIDVVSDNQDKTNQVLQITPVFETSSAWSNVYASIGDLSSQNQDSYAISFGVKSSTTQNKNVIIQLRSESGSYYPVDTIPISNYWQTIMRVFDSPASGKVSLQFSTRSDDSQSDYNSIYYLDNISMKSVLQVGDDNYRQRMCRLYPTNTATGCDYIDAGGRQYRGWQGFCVEEDQGPEYPSLDSSKQMCLNWWPVDILPGETDIFGSDEQAGYIGRQPLYYCLEARGNYPYIRKVYPTRIDQATENRIVVHKMLYREAKKNIGNIGNKVWVLEEKGWENQSGLLVFDLLSLGLYKEDIDRIELKVAQADSDWPQEGEVFVLKPENDWNISWCGSNDKPEVDCRNYNHANWKEYVSGYDSCVNNFKPNANVFGVKAGFDTGSNKNRFKGFEAGVCDASREDGWLDLAVTIYLKEPCQTLVQVVSPTGENYAWSLRIKKGGWTQENYLNYEYTQDYAPYGAAVVPVPASDPTAWDEPLYVMPANKSSGASSPYQPRAGSPYSIVGESGKVCITGNIGKACQTDVDCQNSSATCLFGGGKSLACLSSLSNCCSNNRTQGCSTDSDCRIGSCQISSDLEINISSQCIAGSSDKIGNSCSSSQDCGYSYTGQGYGMCVGINLTTEQKKAISGGASAGMARLSKLFAQSIDTWEWNSNVGRYENNKVTSWEETNSAEIYQPEVKNIKVMDKKDGDIRIEKNQSIVLKFNAQIDENHLPMTAYRVDWGDNSAISQVTNLKIYPHTDENNPHVLFHLY